MYPKHPTGLWAKRLYANGFVHLKITKQSFMMKKGVAGHRWSIFLMHVCLASFKWTNTIVYNFYAHIPVVCFVYINSANFSINLASHLAGIFIAAVILWRHSKWTSVGRTLLLQWLDANLPSAFICTRALSLPLLLPTIGSNRRLLFEWPSYLKL